MADVTAGGPDCPDEQVLMAHRPQRINDMIRNLLTNGTVADLCSPEGQLLRDFFTPGEAARALDLPMPECPDFDGVTCEFCRGRERFSQCQQCFGFFDQSIHQLYDPGVATAAGVPERSSRPYPGLNIPERHPPEEEAGGFLKRFVNRFRKR